jgi:hypothetical protein
MNVLEDIFAKLEAAGSTPVLEGLREVKRRGYWWRFAGSWAGRGRSLHDEA